MFSWTVSETRLFFSVLWSFSQRLIEEALINQSIDQSVKRSKSSTNRFDILNFRLIFIANKLFYDNWISLSLQIFRSEYRIPPFKIIPTTGHRNLNSTNSNHTPFHHPHTNPHFPTAATATRIPIISTLTTTTITKNTTRDRTAAAEARLSTPMSTSAWPSALATSTIPLPHHVVSKPRKTASTCWITMPEREEEACNSSNTWCRFLRPPHRKITFR